MPKEKATPIDEDLHYVLYADEFHILGFSIINQTSTGSVTTQFCCFKAHFGIDWIVCAKLWVLLLPLFSDNSYTLAGAKMVHLLWTLMFLRLYDTEDILAARVGVVEKTYRKWVWLFIDLISYLEVDVVSS